PMHAASLADRLGMERVLVPGPAGVLSAYGLLAADETHDAARTVRLSLRDSAETDLRDAFAELTDRVLADVSDSKTAGIELAADCRYAGQSFELTVDAGGDEDEPGSPADPAALAERFAAAHERAYGYRLDAAVEAVTLRVTATVGVDPPTVSRTGALDAKRGSRESSSPDAGAVEATVYDRRRAGSRGDPRRPRGARGRREHHRRSARVGRSRPAGRDGGAGAGRGICGTNRR
ncbi:5-oxoprolinase, partial [Halorubrum saccharovorum]